MIWVDLQKLEKFSQKYKTTDNQQKELFNICKYLP